MGYRKLGVILSRILITGFIFLSVFLVLVDTLFFNSDAEVILAEFNIELRDDFKILSNESGDFLDYYRKFELEISESDKQQLIRKIIESENYIESIPNNYDIRSKLARYTKKQVAVKYQNKCNYKSEFFRTNGKGFKPTYIIISISKIDNRLTFEKIED